MLARRVDRIAGRIVLDHLDVGHQRRARQRSFEQIVAQHRVFGDPAVQRRLHRVDVVEPLAGEGALAEHVLVEVGNGKDIRVDAAVGRQHALQERRLVAGGQRRRHARLQDRIAGDHVAGAGLDHRPVERMAELADQPVDRVAHHARVGVERHDMDDAFGQRRIRRQEGRVGVAAQQKVQLVQLAALALPAHPAFLRWRCRGAGGAAGRSAARRSPDSAG